MSRLLGSAPWCRQPQVPVGINRGNPLANRLVFAYNGATILDHARGVRPTAYPYASEWTGARIIDGNAGTEFGDFIGPWQGGYSGSGYDINFQGFPALGPSITLFARACITTNNAMGGFVFAFADETNDRGFELKVSSDAHLSVWAADSNTSWTQAVSGPSFLDNDIVNLVVVVNGGGQITLYTSLSQTAYISSGNFSNANAANSALCVGAYNTAGSGPLLGLVGCAMLWDRAFSEREARAVIANPWQVFSPLKRASPLLPVAAAWQILTPNGDVSVGGWVSSLGGTLSAAIDETSPDAADYIVDSTGSSAEISCTSGNNPLTGGGYVDVQMGAGSGNLSISLKQGGTTLQSWGPFAYTASAQDLSLLITATITNASDLRLVFTSS